MLLPASKQKVIGEKKTQTLSLDAEKFTLLKSTGICYNKKKIIFKQKKIKYIFCGFVVLVFFFNYSARHHRHWRQRLVNISANVGYVTIYSA